MSTGATVARKWWKEGTAYQIWPASYKDSNGDGIGDLPGIISTLDQLKELGVDIIWVSPAYASPKKDMGYDISDYEDIDPQFGTLADAEHLIKECHALGIRLLFDLVINHTSDEHAWFKESRSSRTNPKRDWYIWRPPRFDADGQRRPPNNWRSFFGGSAWEWDEPTQEYYLHLFVREQPDLNWENPETRRAIYASAVQFWLDKGIDGFRIDAVNLYSKPVDYSDAPIVDPSAEFQPAFEIWSNGPRMHEFLRELHDATFAKADVMIVGELGNTYEQSKVLEYVSAQAKQMDMVFRFDVVNLGRKHPGDSMIPTPFTLRDFKQAYVETQKLAGDPSNDGWGTAFLENHDVARSLSRFATDRGPYRARAAKLLALLLAASSGTLFLYQGQEIGMINAPTDWPEENYRDAEVMNYLAEQRARHPDNEKAAVAKTLPNLAKLSRDNARCPIPWTAEKPNAGFTSATATPWIPMLPGFEDGWNVHAQSTDPASVRSFWRTALTLRKQRIGAFVYGQFRMLEVGGDELFVFEKTDVGHIDDGQAAKVIVVLNFTENKQKLPALETGVKLGLVLLDNVDGSEAEILEPWEGRIYEALP